MQKTQEVEWIDIKDRAPLECHWVLTCNEGYHGGYLCWYENETFYIHGRGKYSKIPWIDKDKSKPTHWMYFPPPKGIKNGYPDEG